MIDLKHYRKVKEDKKTAVLRHKDGHEFKVAKQALSAQERRKLDSMPHYFPDGGLVPGLDEKEEATQVPDWMKHLPPSSASTEQPAPNASPASQESPAPVAQESSIGNELGQSANKLLGQAYDVAAPAVEKVMHASPTYQAYQFGRGLQGKGTSDQPQEVKAPPKMPDDDQVDLRKKEGQPDQHVEQMQNRAQLHQQLANNLFADYRKLQNDYNSTKLDPYAVSKKMGFGEKMLKIVGLALGGGGAGMARQENLLAKLLDGELKRNTDQQIAEMDKKKNLLSEFTKMFGNLPDAKEYYAVMQLGNLSAMFKQQANQLSDPAKKQQALQLSQMYDQQAGNIMNGLALRQSQQFGMNQGGGSGGMSKIMTLPHQWQKPAYDELHEAQKVKTFRNLVMKNFDDVAELNTLSNRALSLGQAKAKMDAKLKPLVAQMSKEFAGRYTESDAEAMGAFFKSLLERDGTVEEKRRALESFLMTKEKFPLLQEFQIDVGVPDYYRPVKRTGGK